jgi:uncharacterized protein (TIGR01777 family)
MRALVTGATGLVGQRLFRQLDSAVALSRSVASACDLLGVDADRVFAWNPTESLPPIAAFAGIDVIFHLAGESVAKGRWSEAKKKRILDSRVVGTRHLVDQIANLTTPPPLLISASAVGFYGPCGQDVLDEESPPGDDFLSDVCVQWEAEAERATEAGLRVINPRIGIVLSTAGGALKEMLTPFKCGLGGRLGKGQHWWPWIHIDDLVKTLLFMASTPELSGAYNVTAPNPVTNLTFTKTLGRVIKRPTCFPMPPFMLRLLVGEFAEVLMASSRTEPSRLLDAGFSFDFAELEPALRDILQKD